jgi:predicted MFS family arabinose efflux permease
MMRQREGTSAQDARQKWLLVALLFFGAALNYGDRTAVTAVFPLLRRDLGMSDMALAAVGTFFLWSYALCSPVAGYLGDRFSRTTLIATSLGAWSAVTLASALVSNSPQLLTMRLLLGVAEAAYMPAAIALLAEHHGQATRATALSIHTAGYSSGLVVGGVLAGYLGQRFGWRAALMVLGLGGIVLAAVAVRFFAGLGRTQQAETIERTPSACRIPPLRAAKMVFGHPTCRLVLLQAMLASSAMWILITWMPLYFHDNLGMTLAQAGFAGTFYAQSSGIVGMLAGGRLSDAVAERKGIRQRILLQGGLYLAAAPFLLVFLRPHELYVIAGGIVGFFLLLTLGSCNEGPVLTEILPAHLRATTIGLSNSLNCIAGGTGVLLAGYAKHALGLPIIFGAASGIYLACACILFAGYSNYEVLTEAVPAVATWSE